MSFERDPARWSDPNNTEVPEALRDLMQAGLQEGPSAAKLSVLGAQVSAKVGAGAGASAGGLSAAKLWIAGLSVAGALATTAAMVWPHSQPDAVPAATEPAAMPAPPAGAEGEVRAPVPERVKPPAPARQAAPAASATPTPRQPAQEPEVAERPQGKEHAGPARERSIAESPRIVPAPAGAGQAPPRSRARAGRDLPEARTTARAPQRSTEAVRRAEARQAEASQALQREDSAEPQTSGPSDVELLLEARRALRVSPRRALTLAQGHAARFPDSQFRQERDALVIEALTRDGQLERARQDARRFVRRYPDSAAAHRFRERLEL